MIWLMSLLISALVWLQLLDRYGKLEHFMPDTKIGHFYVGTISAFEHSVFSDALRELADMQIDVAEGNARFEMLRLQVIAMCCCDRFGWRVYDHNNQAHLRELQDMPQYMLEELANAVAIKARLSWVGVKTEASEAEEEHESELAINPS